MQADRFELYDRQKDTHELSDLYEKGHPELAGMRERLTTWEKGRVQKWGVRFISPSPADPEEIEKLRNLGYIK